MNYSIQVVDQFHYHANVIFGLDVLAPSREFPVCVGCSLRNLKGEIVDIPARWLKSPGLVLWEIKLSDIETASLFKVNQLLDSGWQGQVIFAFYPDDSYTTRLADTGWVNWKALWLIGSSTKGLDMQDEHIKAKFGHRFKEWLDGKDS